MMSLSIADNGIKNDFFISMLIYAALLKIPHRFYFFNLSNDPSLAYLASLILHGQQVGLCFWFFTLALFGKNPISIFEMNLSHIRAFVFIQGEEGNLFLFNMYTI